MDDALDVSTDECSTVRSLLLENMDGDLHEKVKRNCIFALHFQCTDRAVGALAECRESPPIPSQTITLHI